MTTAKHENELQVALDAAAAATQVILENYAAIVARADAPADITTETDRAAQNVILQKLSNSYPDDAFRGEENTNTLSQLRSMGRRMWIIDPIDGTRGFVTKNGEFSVMIALAVDGEVVVGVVAEPARDCITFARKDGGCWQRTGSTEHLRVQVSAQSDLQNCVVIQSHTKPGRGLTSEVQRIGPARVIETYSAGVKLARVADGTADIYVCDYAAMNDWDLAAGHILVAEAGGRVSNLAGEPRVYGRESVKQYGGLLATNGLLHETAIGRLVTK